MRACWHCTQLIHDDATVCRFCKESVPQMHSIEERQNFTNRFQQLSTRSRWDLWQTTLAARGESPTSRVTGAVGADARRPDAGDVCASARRGNEADGPAAPVTRRAPGVCARWLCFSSSTMTKHLLPPPALPANADPWRATARDFYHGLLGSGERRYAQKVLGMEAPERFGISLPQKESQVVHGRYRSSRCPAETAPDRILVAGLYIDGICHFWVGFSSR